MSTSTTDILNCHGYADYMQGCMPPPPLRQSIGPTLKKFLTDFRTKK
jgi:hypothetical protein